MLRRAAIASCIAALGSAQTAVNTASSPSPSEPCARIASAQAAENQTSLVVPAEIAYDCLQSVPVDKEGDSKLIDEIKLYFEWNTNTAYLKGDLPDWYDNPSIDVYKELDNIKASVQKGDYRSEWEVQDAITYLFSQTGDNHILWQSDISNVFSFEKGLSLVSVSNENKAPAIYSYDDLSLLWYGQSNFTASSINKINGVDAIEYLKKIGRRSTYHDAHARWNSLFPNHAGTSLGSKSLGNWYMAPYDGANTTYAFSNGTTRTIINAARVIKDFTGVEDGKSFFAKFCTGQPSTSSNQKRDSTPTAPERHLVRRAEAPQATHTQTFNYPPAEFLHPGNAIGGYYINGTEDVAVLSIPTFEPKTPNMTYSQQGNNDFQEVAREFLKKANADGKTKLIIDLRFNGGGSTVLGFDLFKLLFPNLEPYQATRRRAHEGFKQLVDLASYELQRKLSEIDPENLEDSNVLETSNLSEFLYNLAITPNDTEFTSSEEFYGPHKFENDEFTSLRGQNLTNTLGWATNFTVTGHGGELATREPSWNASSIVLLQDGYCSSTCAIFSELMRTLAGVETLAVGGLPDDKIPMQKVGGTKGWLTWTLDSLDRFPYNFYKYANQSTIYALNGTEIYKMNHTSVIFDRYASFQVNAADGIRRGDEEKQTPLQFVYEAAECRLWYTFPMVFSPVEVWKAVSKTRWGGGSCNAGKGFGTLAKEGDGDKNQEKPKEHGNAASGLNAPGLTAIAVVSAITMIVQL